MKSNNNAVKIIYDEIVNEKNEKAQIIEDIKGLSKELAYAYERFDLISEEVLIDSQIYEIKAIQLKYQYLIQKAKDLGIFVKNP